jgi:hypothetical protein
MGARQTPSSTFPMSASIQSGHRSLLARDANVVARRKVHVRNTLIPQCDSGTHVALATVITASQHPPPITEIDMAANTEERAVLSEITSKAAVDGVFRQKLLTNTRAAVAEVIGQDLPADFSVKFIEKDPGYDTVIVLPDLILEAQELSLDELEAVAGGDCWFASDCMCTACCVTGDASPSIPIVPV